MNSRELDYRTTLPIIFVALIFLSQGTAPAQTFENASSGLPATHMWDCNAVAWEECNTILDTGGWVGIDFADVNDDGFDDLGAVGRLLYGFRVWLSNGAGNWMQSSVGFDLDECHGHAEVDFGDRHLRFPLDDGPQP